MYLGKINSIFTDFNSPYCYFVGDFNADITECNGKVNKAFGRELISFVEEEEFIICDQMSLCKSSYTYISDAHSTTSWLDHCITSKTGSLIIKDMDILYDFVTSDHKPLVFSLLVSGISTITSDDLSGKTNNGINWCELEQSQLIQYTKDTMTKLKQVKLPSDVIYCNDVQCNDKDHQIAICELYGDITKTLLDCSKSLVKRKKFKAVPGWSEYCKLAHDAAREAFLLWRAQGSPRFGDTFNHMSRTRAYFKRCLRKCKTNSEKCKADALARKLITKDSRNFWKDIQNLSGKKTMLLSDKLDGVSGQHEIAGKWYNHYSDLLNCNQSDNGKQVVMSALKNCNQDDLIKVNVDDIETSLKDLKCGKSSGNDSVQAEHFKYASDVLYVLLSLLFSMCISHGFIPSGIMHTIIVPIVKDKKGDISDKDNYRPIAITSVFSKVFELVILLKYSDTLLKTTFNQFGFKKKSSTDLCVFAFKEIVDLYRSQSSPVFICFIDASKAFDLVCHWILFKKLLNRLPIIIIRLLVYWYSCQEFLVKWGNIMSNGFKVSNGVRQGGVLSPILFNIYLDDLSRTLNRSYNGCRLNGVSMNHLIYADDMVLLAPSPDALQSLLDICNQYASEHCIKYNSRKTVCMTILPKWLKSFSVPDFKLNGSKLKTVKQQKYLGVFITDTFTDDLDINRQVRSTYCIGNMIISRFRFCTEDVKLQLFKTYACSLYASQLWSRYIKSSTRKLKVAYNNVCRYLFKLDRYSSMSAFMVKKGLKTLSEVIRNYMFSFYTRICNCDNMVIDTILNSSFFLGSIHLQEWICQLFIL